MDKSARKIFEEMSFRLDHITIEDCAKDGGKEFFPRYTAFELQIFNDSIGIRLKNALHLGKKFLAAIFSTILYYSNQMSGTKCHHEILQQCAISYLPGNSHTPPTYKTSTDDLKGICRDSSW